MHDVIEESHRLMRENKPHVVATVVRTRGMTPQKAGARQLIREDGSSMGTLGGGCVEGDIWYYAKEMLRNRTGPEFREYYLNAAIAEQDGLVCGGTMYFFLEPMWQPADELAIIAEAVQSCRGGPPVAVATVVRSADEKVRIGSKLLIRNDGTTSGSLGAPELETKAAKVAARVAPFGKNETILAADGTEVYVEGFTTPPTLIILGGGHVGRAVYNVATTLGFRIIIVDDRPEFSNKERFPAAHATVVAEFDRAFDDIAVDFNSFILIATRGHRFDDMATRAAVNTPARYIGLLGSKRKNMLIFRQLIESGVPAERVEEVHAPVGLNIGALTPEEIAVSIVAEIIQTIRGGDGSPMSKAGEASSGLTDSAS